MTSIAKYIEQEIVVSSGDALLYGETSLGITNEAARKRLQRLPKDIYKIKGICRDGQSILYHKDSWGSPEFFDKLIEVLKNNAKQHYAVLNAINLHHGVIPKDILPEYTVSPVGKIKGHKSFNSIIKDLISLHIIEATDDTYKTLGCAYNENKSKALNVIHKITIADFCEWGRNIGLFSYNSAKFHTEISSYLFAMTAPSYIKSLVSKSKNEKPSPAFVVADILLNREIKKDDIEFFIKKLENVSMRNPAKIIPFLIIGTHDKEVYHTLKSNGILVGNIDALFDKKYSESLYGILNLIENAGAILKSNPDQYLKLIKSIEALSFGKTYNLKGALFEMAVGYYHGQQSCKTLDISKKISYNKCREIDVYAEYHNSVVFAECKGYNHKIEDDYVEKWLSEKIPVIRDWALRQDSIRNKQFVFEIWSTGGFTDKSYDKLSIAHNKTKKYQIDFYDFPQMLQIAKEQKIPHFIEILNSYYTKEI